MFNAPLLATFMWVDPLVNGSEPPTFSVLVEAMLIEAPAPTMGVPAKFTVSAPSPCTAKGPSKSHVADVAALG